MATASGSGAPGSTAVGAGFADDPRVHFNQVSGKWEFEADDGREYEWSVARNSWVPLVEEDLVAAQQAAYKVEGVDENVPSFVHPGAGRTLISNLGQTPAAPVLAREKKRKKGVGDDDPEGGPSKRKGKGSAPQRNTAVYVTQLPLDAQPDDLYPVFSKAGLILEDERGQPRIKIYKDAEGRSKGEALVVYLKEDSVELAIRLLDDSELRLGEGGETMKVAKAEFTPKEPGDRPNEDGKSDHSKKRRQKKIDKLKSKLGGWESDEEAPVVKSRNDKVVVLKHMFTRQELEEDPALLLDLKEDVRDEAETLGEVTNVTLYDVSPACLHITMPRSRALIRSSRTTES